MDPSHPFPVFLRLLQYTLNATLFNTFNFLFPCILLCCFASWYTDHRLLILASYTLTISLIVHTYYWPEMRSYIFGVPEVDRDCTDILLLFLTQKEEASERECEELDQDDCPICLQSVSLQGETFAHLEHCAHFFCGSCLLHWRTQSLSCPLCSVLSIRFLLHPKLIKSQDDKRDLFTTKGHVVYF